ncbi:hypothetical protein NPIL_46221 [Nephila pilipes]|uniref:Uncharacterized protein n=1 Tax=Nephila pilipes TaxID=299642 RepID=A0A8X6UVH8_NEPPI|nr:hypothetical protein NPIL_46221 [Nephila pilipes]
MDHKTTKRTFLLTREKTHQYFPKKFQKEYKNKDGSESKAALPEISSLLGGPFPETRPVRNFSPCDRKKGEMPFDLRQTRFSLNRIMKLLQK